MYSRIKRLQRQLDEQGIDFAVIKNPTDVYYFTGTGTQATLIVPNDGEPTLLVRINYERAKRDCYIPDIRRSRGRQSVVELLEQHDPETVGMALDIVPEQLVEGLVEAPSTEMDVLDCSSSLLETRQQKGETEVDAIEEAAAISEECLTAVPDLLEPGITEGELQSELEKIKRRNGAEPEMVFRQWNASNNFGVLASGPNTAEISGFWITNTGTGMHDGRPFGSSTRTISEGDVFLVDHGTLVDGYHSDEARTYVVGEGRSDVERDIDILFECLAAAKEAVEPGVSAGAPFNAAKAVAAEYDRADAFMALGQYGIEYVGHGVGLAIDEPPMLSPFSDVTLEAGMTLALEPKFIHNDQWGATVEDTVLVTDDGYRTLTNSPRELIRC